MRAHTEHASHLNLGRTLKAPPKVHPKQQRRKSKEATFPKARCHPLRGFWKLGAFTETTPGVSGGCPGVTGRGCHIPSGPAATPGRGSSTPSRQTPGHGTLCFAGLCLKRRPLVTTFVLPPPPPSPRPSPAAEPLSAPLGAARGRGEAAQQKADPVSPPANLCP